MDDSIKQFSIQLHPTYLYIWSEYDKL